MLIYAGTVKVLAEDFVHPSDECLQGDGAKAIIALVAGAACMDALGRIRSMPRTDALSLPGCAIKHSGYASRHGQCGLSTTTWVERA